MSAQYSEPPLLPNDQHDDELPHSSEMQQQHHHQHQLPAPFYPGQGIAAAAAPVAPPQVRLRIGPHIALRTAQQRRRQLQRNAAIMEELNNEKNSNGEAATADEEQQQQQQSSNKFSVFPFSTICDVATGGSPTKAAPHKQYPSRVPFPQHAIPAPVQTFSGRGLGESSAQGNGAPPPPGAPVSSGKSRCPTQSAAQLLEIARRAATLHSPYNFHRFSSAAAAAAPAVPVGKQHEQKQTTAAAPAAVTTIPAATSGGGGRSFKPADNLSPLIKDAPPLHRTFDRAEPEDSGDNGTSVTQKPLRSESPVPTLTADTTNNNKQLPPRLHSTLSLATSATPNDSPVPSPEKLGGAAATQSSNRSAAAATGEETTPASMPSTSTEQHTKKDEDSGSVVCLSSFDALFLKLAPAPRCFTTCPAGVARQAAAVLENNGGGSDKKTTTTTSSSNDDFPIYSEAQFLAIGLGWAQRSCAEHKSHFSSSENNKKSSNNKKDEEDEDEDNDKCCDYADRMSNIVSVIYPQWEDHLRVAMAACTAKPGSSLMVSERLLPPLYMGRPELHDLVVAHMCDKKKQQQKCKEAAAAAAASAEESHHNQHEQQYVAAVSDVSSSVSSPISPPVAAADGAAGSADGVAPMVAASPLSSSSGVASPSSEEFGASATPSQQQQRAGLFALPARGRPQRLKAELHNKVMSVLSRVTPVKYTELRAELLDLPIRQAGEEQLDKVVDVFFMKAVQEPAFSNLYADLVMSVFDVANEEKEALMRRSGSSTIMSPDSSVMGGGGGCGGGGQFPKSASTADVDPITGRANSALSSFEERTAQRTEQLAHRLRTSLLHKCHKEFSRPPVLDAARDLTDRETGELLPLAEQQERWSNFRKRLKANVRFVGELYNRGAVTDCVVNAALSVLLIQVGALASARIPPYARGGGCKNMNDHIVEVFVTMLEVVGPKFRAMMPQRCERMLATARHLSKTHSTPRTRFLLLNLLDAADGKGDKRWNARAVNSGSGGGGSYSSPATAAANAAAAAAAGSPASTALPHLNSGFSSPATPYHHHQHPLPHQQQSQGNLGSHLSLPSRMSSMSRLGSTQDLSGSGGSGMLGGGGGNRPPPPSYEHAVASTSNPSSPVQSLPQSASRQSVNGTPVSQSSGIPPPLQSNSNNHVNFPSCNGDSGKASSDDLSSATTGKSSIDSNKRDDAAAVSSSSSALTNTMQSVVTATRLVPSSQRLQMLCNLPTAAECGLSSEESVSLGEALLQLEKHQEELFEEQVKMAADAATEAASPVENEEEQDDDDDFGELDDLPPKLLELKFHHLLAFVVPGSQQKQKQSNNGGNNTKKQFASSVHSCLWEPAEKLWGIVARHTTTTATMSGGGGEDDVEQQHQQQHPILEKKITDSAAMTTQLTVLFSEMLTTAQNNTKSSNNHKKETALFRSGLAFLIAIAVSTPCADGSGMSALEPALAKSALLQALTGTGVVASEQECASTSVCTGGMPAVQQQSTTRRFFEALGGGGEGSEGNDALQRLCRGWSAFCDGV